MRYTENRFDNLTQAETDSLYKALSTNNWAQADGIDGQTGGSALITESLETTLRSLTYKEDNFKIWKDIPKTKAYSTVEEYNVVDSYGEDISAFNAEGIAGLDTTGSYSREFQKVKCLNTTRSVTDLLNNFVQTTENAEQVETKSGMLYLMGQAEKAIFYGDSDLASDGKEGLEWNGIIKTVSEEGNVIDLKGQYLDDKTLNYSSEMILDNYGIPSKAYMPIPVASVFSEQYYPDQRAFMNAQPGELTAGTTITKFNSMGGTIDISPDVFMRRGTEALDPSAQAFGSVIPSTPDVQGEVDTSITDVSFEEGTYKYAVVVIGAKGKSAPVANVSVAVGPTETKNAVKLTITNDSSQMEAPEYFIIYRTEKDGDKYYEIGRIGAESSAPGAVTEFVDKNEVLPNTAMAVVGDFRGEETIAFKQLSPMFKLDYARVAPVKRFGIFLYGTPIVYAPKKFVVIKNIKIDR